MTEEPEPGRLEYLGAFCGVDLYMDRNVPRDEGCLICTSGGDFPVMSLFARNISAAWMRRMHHYQLQNGAKSIELLWLVGKDFAKALQKLFEPEDEDSEQQQLSPTSAAASPSAASAASESKTQDE